MKIMVIFIALSLGLIAFAEDSLDVRFLTTQRTKGNPFALPVYISTDGSVAYSKAEASTLSFRPNALVGFSRSVINYSHPVLMNRFNLYPQQKDLGWIEVKRLRLEGGLGLSALVRVTKLGLVPYKGAMHTIIRHKQSKEEESLPFRMPTQLADLVAWNVNDHGTFQTYGGITAYAGIDFGLNLLLGSVGLQNQFIVEMKKVDHDTVDLIISEENLHRRQLVLGPALAKATFAKFDGKRFSSEFRLDLLNPTHHLLFQEALKGNLTSLQDVLEDKRQKQTWTGNDRSYYVGIPVVAGKSIDSGRYDLSENGEEAKLDYTGMRMTGFLTPVKNFQDFVYQKDNALLLVWSSEMNRATKADFLTRFLKIGRTLGIKGFHREVPDSRFGSVVSQIAVHLSRKEFESISESDMEKVSENLRSKCESENLPCREEETLSTLISRFNNLRARTWIECRKDLGLLLLKEPAVMNAVVRALKLKKDVYFKFLSERYQSLEGTSAVEI